MFTLSLATLLTGVFFGAAVYVSVVEHPARLSCGPDLAVREFGPSYRRGAALQATLAGLGCAAGVQAGWLHHDYAAIIAGILLGTLIPYTLLVVLPTNKRLLDPALNARTPEAGELLRRWGWLHAVRTAVGGIAFTVFVSRLAVASA